MTVKEGQHLIIIRQDPTFWKQFKATSCFLCVLISASALHRFKKLSFKGLTKGL